LIKACKLTKLGIRNFNEISQICNMETLIVHPKNKEQLMAMKSFMKAFKISFEEESSVYSPEFVAKINESREQVKRGETRVVNIDDL